MINMLVGKKGGKPVTPLSVMGYEDAGTPEAEGRPPTQREKELSQQATALRFRLLQAGMRNRGVK